MARSDQTTYPYEPDYAVAPGETLAETIESLGMDQKELATRLGMTEKHVSQVINGHVSLTYEMADKLELVTGVPARIWNNLEMKYRERLTKIEASKRLETSLNWLNRVPTKELAERRKIEVSDDKPTMLRSVLGFFGVSSVDAWEALWLTPAASFRRSRCFESKPEATAAWLRLGELEAISIRCKPFEKTRFKAALDGIRKLTVLSPNEFQPKMTSLCAEAGVALVFVPEMKGCPASGAARWMTAEKAIIQLSLRFKTDDHFWFSFFHEAGHVANDPKKEVFIDDNLKEDDERERKANAFAASLLIPSSRALELPGLKKASDVRRFAESIGIAPGIVVGRLQHEKLIQFSYMNELKQRFTWAAA